MFTQNPEINTCHIFVLLHKSIFLTFVCKTDVQIKTWGNHTKPSQKYYLQGSKVLVEMPDAHNGFQEVCHLLRRLQPLLKARRFLDEKELDLLETLCLEVGVVFPRVFKGSVAPKIHDLVFHLPRIARHLGTVGGVREDNLESKHAIGNSLRRRLACVRAEEEKLKLMLQLDEVQLRLKSAEFSKPATRRIRKLNNETGWFCLTFSFIL